MREIKFRVWDGLKMHHVSGLYLMEDGSFHVSVGLHDEYIVSELMQYTGLKDSTGREIFEGDIVKCIAESEYQEDSRISDVIRGDCGQWQVRELQEEDVIFNHGLPLNWGGWLSIEVIGNIYENPELLEKE